MSKINYDLWKNENGKVVIPDGVTTTWPEGDALVGNFIYNEGILSGFVDTMALVANESKSTTIPYDYVDITVDKSLEGIVTFHPGERCKHLNISYTESGNTIVLGTKYLGCRTIDDIKAVDANYETNDIIDGVWSQSLADLEDGTNMFCYYPNLTIFTSDLSSLTNGDFMFRGCKNLTTLASDSSGSPINLNSLTNGYCMFCDCTNLTTFDFDLISLTNGTSMFGNCPNISSYSNNLKSIIEASWMFSNCSNLTTFTSDLKTLVIGNYMFYECSNLTSFTSDLRSLTDALDMFTGCKLDTPSVQNIANTINGNLENAEGSGCASSFRCIGIGIANNTPNTEEDAAFRLMTEKGWTVYVNGSSDASYQPDNFATLDENGEVVSAPIPFYAKPVQTDEKHARYMDSEGNYFNILGAQFIYGDDLSTYGMFTCEEDAAMNMGLTKIEK